ncbi:MAG: RNA methyltransferase [Prevotellaceae bacterium]|jgi:tRNA G18 (ribose-2'-O)-methylase SpoU|nr:RNA methyltransferase [Prevotellaceae bacterium]
MPRKLLNSELNRLTTDEFKQSAKYPLVLVLDNIRSQHNIGAAFRTADAFRIEKIYLCGICATPPTADIHKSALGAENTVEWQYVNNTIDAIQSLKNERYNIVTIEQVENSMMLNDYLPDKNRKYALVFGNEIKGISQEVVDSSDYCIEIPQIGTKHSLNISVSVGIVLWDFVQKIGIL